MECNSKHESNFIAELEVNGQKIDLNRFVESFIAQSIIGMLKSLRGVDVVETIDLKISKEAKDPKSQ
ncbi:MAG: hypothetical protein FVQ82_09695 [Planctomycetes bacterium]|nr:hypothetical protein [Planctomycetota bacterium]